MAKEVRISVPGGLVGHGTTFKEVVLREPLVEEYWDLGEIVSVAKAPDGTVFWVENGETFRGYLSKPRVAARPAVAGAGRLAARAQHQGCHPRFFSRATSAAEPSATSDTTSSSSASPAASPQTP